ncbi:hypothetical protein [Bacillus sp. FJAT-47783]|uniref:hypothetical protein n=1 Tax=Bacillus sp. FJAT-47783 TaxID=2922712 RepID=UPI001FAC7B9B|nr:hypothetical protein [Bacillus sp. FJAT-47783]
MRSMSGSFNKEECIKNVRVLLNLAMEELPHYDTVNNFLSSLDIRELEKIRTYMIKELLRNRFFEQNRIKEKYWGVIVDGTGLHNVAFP